MKQTSILSFFQTKSEKLVALPPEPKANPDTKASEALEPLFTRVVPEDPRYRKQLDLEYELIDANKFTAEAAESRGCKVLRAKSAVEAAELIKSDLDSGSVLLAKGSQNAVYAEETIKRLLANQDDSEKLVRQNSYWPDKKQKYFSSVDGK